MAAAALILFSLIAGLAGTLWQAHVADRERALAEQRFSDASKLANYLLFPLYDSVRALPGSLPIRADMAGKSLQYLDRLAVAKSNDRALPLELAEGYVRLGTILEAPFGAGEGLGDASNALDSDQKAVALLVALNKENGKDQRLDQDLARAYLLLGSVLNIRGKPAEMASADRKFTIALSSAAIARSCLAISMNPPPALLRASPNAMQARPASTKLSRSRGCDAVSRSKMVVASVSFATPSSGDNRAMLGLAQAYNLKGNTQASRNVGEALPTYHLGLEALNRLSPEVRAEPASHALEARLMTMIGFCLEETGLFLEAIATLAPAQEILDRLAAQDPKNATNALRRVNLYRTRAFAHQYAEHIKDAIADYRKTIEILDGMIAIDPAKLSNKLVRAELQEKLGAMLVKDRHQAEAEQITKTSLKFWTEVAERPDAAPQNLKEAASAFIVGAILSLLDYPRALRYAQRADQLAKGQDTGAIFYIAQCYEQMGDGPRALEAVKRGLALFPATLPGEKRSRNRLLMEKHLRRIQVLIETGHLPNNK